MFQIFKTKSIHVILLLAVLAGCDNHNVACKPIVAAYPAWPIVDFSIEDIRWDYFTHLGVVAIYPLADGTLNTQDADGVLPALLAAAKTNNKKVIISIGGSGEAGKGFLALTKSAQTQQVFVREVVDYIQRYDLAGVDIDWEYWTFQNVLGKGGQDPEESRRLVNLLKALRAELPADKLLSVDIFVGDWVGRQYLPEIEQYVDYINVMAYDFTGAWPESPVGHHADFATFKRALAFTRSQGFKPEKLLVGLPTYGIEFQEGSNAAIKHWPFRDILKRLSQANGKSDALKRGHDQDLYFETPSLIDKKAQLIQQGAYAGAMVFELTGDSLDPQTSLLRRVHQRLQAVGCQSE